MTANQMTRHSIRIPQSAENTEYFVDAETPAEAADLFVQAIVNEAISVDCADLFDARRVEVTRLPPVGQTARVVNWEETTDMQISVDDIPAFSAAIARGWNRDGGFDEPEDGSGPGL